MPTKKDSGSKAYRGKEFKAACQQVEAKIRTNIAAGKIGVGTKINDTTIRKWAEKSVKHKQDQVQKK